MKAFWCALGVLAVHAGCGSSTETKDTVPSRPGFQMPEGGTAKINETDACAELSKALTAAAQKLSCSAPAVACPSYVRPAGGEGCFEYDKASVEACVKLIQGYARCSELDSRRCIVTAISIPGQCHARPPDASADDGGGDDAAGDAAEDVAPASDAAEDTLIEAGSD